MRMSSRGTVSMGPLGWLIAGPFLVAMWLAWTALMGAVWLVAAVVSSIAESRSAPAVKAVPGWPHIPPSGAR